MAALFLPLPVDYSDDPALDDAGERAELLYIRARCAMKARETDGRISDLQLRRLGLSGAKARADRLVAVGLWEQTDGGYLDPRFLEDNPSAAELETFRDNKRRAGQLGNHRRWHADKPEPDCDYCTRDRSTDRTSDRSTDRKPVAKGREGEEKREKTGMDGESTEPLPAPDPSLSSSPPSSPDVAHGYRLLGEWQGDMSEKQLGIMDEWTAERGGSEDWLAVIAASNPEDFYAAASEDHRRWRRQNKRRGSRASSTGSGWQQSPADLRVIEEAHR